ncbi:tRNA pseudouridine synthase-like 1 isoform X6 [Peromyscus leucopus]|uniref:tRNA pseudouridine synthase-like 1 isoform X6 n=1 Tax=Peromyscus leucopus TaxID=10041 RepID=UPI0010A134F9|nr:tRNA pseudouridine synthase-like 1 isoform X6 [Peromyscus leucopus]
MSSCGAVGSVRARYLVFFQYLGTDFNGVAAVRGNHRAVGVQNFLEEAAKRLNSVEPIRFTISSRTDAGVHALSNAAHLDIHRRSGLPPYSPEVVAQALNTHLRHRAIRCLDVAAMQEAAQHLLGTHDFSAFQSAGSPATNTVRTLRRVSVSSGPASPFVLPQESRRLQFWTLEFESQSFLYRQLSAAGTEDDSCAGSCGARDSDTHTGESNSGESRSSGSYILSPVRSNVETQLTVHSGSEEPYSILSLAVSLVHFTARSRD